MSLAFLKPSSQVNNFTVFFHFFMGMSKSVFSICLGRLEFPVQTNLVWKTMVFLVEVNNI